MRADNGPYLDAVWDAVHTGVRPAVGATSGYLIGEETAGLDAAVGAATGGVTALISPGIKSGLIAAVNTSPEPASIIVLIPTEDIPQTGVTALPSSHPCVTPLVSRLLLFYCFRSLPPLS